MLKGKCQDGNISSSNNDINLASEGYESLKVLVISPERSESDWVLDLRCIFHMSPNMHWLTNLEE